MIEIADYLEGLLLIFDELMQKAVNILTTGPEAFNTTLYSITQMLSQTFSVIGVALLVLFFFMNMVQTYGSMAEMNRPQIIFKELFRLVICNVVVTNAFTLMIRITAIGNGIILSGYESAFQYVGSNSTIAMDQTLEDTLADTDFGLLSLGIPQLFTVIVSLILLIAIAIAAIYLFAFVYGRIFKIYLYMAIAPIPLATFACRGIADTGKHFLKSFCGVLLQGLILVLTMLLFSAFFASPEALDPNDGIVLMILKWGLYVLIRLITLITIIKGADRITKDMLGI